MTVRAAVAADAAGLVGLFAALGYPTEAGAIVARIERNTRPEYACWVFVTEDGEIAGFAGGHVVHPWEHHDPAAQLMILVVDERHRGLGVGSRLVEVFEEWARGLGVARVHVTSNAAREAAHRFYNGRGYETTGFRFGKKLTT